MIKDQQTEHKLILWINKKDKLFASLPQNRGIGNEEADGLLEHIDRKRSNYTLTTQNNKLVKNNKLKQLTKQKGEDVMESALVVTWFITFTAETDM